MNKYKYTRKEWVKNFTKWLGLEEDRKMFPKEIDEEFFWLKKLLATLSPEEESQKIMMEQVDKPIVSHGFSKVKKPNNTAKEMRLGLKECKHKWKITDILNGDFFCPLCNRWIKYTPSPIEFEEIEEMSDNCEDDFDIDEAVGALIRNQKKIINKLNQIK